MTTPFETFVNTELPKRLATNESPITPQAGDIPVFTGVGLLTEAKTAAEAGLATQSYADTAANTAETNAKTYADGIVTSMYKFQSTYDPQVTGNFPATANTVGGVAIKKGFTWVVSGVTGQYTFQGVTVDNGDTLLALVDNASSTTSTDWHITEKNLGYTPENSSNKYSNNDLAGGAGTYPATPNVKAYVDSGLSGKQNTLADVITAGAYGSSTQYPVITFNAKGIATGVTLQTVSATRVATVSGTIAAQPSIDTRFTLIANTALSIDPMAIGMVWEFSPSGNYSLTINSTTSLVLVEDDGTIIDTLFASYTIAIPEYRTLKVKRYSNYVVLQRGWNGYNKSGDAGLISLTGAGAGNTKYKTSFVRSGVSFVGDTTVTFPDKSLNFGDLPSVATTDTNSLTGARSRIVSGTNNTLPSSDSTIASSDYCSTASGNSNSSIVGCKRSVISGTGTYNKLMYCLGGNTVQGANLSGSGSRNIVVGALAVLETGHGVVIQNTASENFVYAARANFNQYVNLRGSTERCALFGVGGGTDLNNCTDSALIAVGGSSVTDMTWTSAQGVLQLGRYLPVQAPVNGSSYYGLGVTGFYYSAQFRLYNTTAGTNIVLTANGSGTVAANNSPNIENIESGGNTYDVDIYLTDGTGRVAACRRRVFVNLSFSLGNFIQVDTVGTDITWGGKIPTVTITIDAGTNRLKVACSATTSALNPITDLMGSAFVTMRAF